MMFDEHEELLGLTQPPEVVAAFEEARSVLQGEGRVDDEDHPLEILDALHRWALPGKRFPPSPVA